MKRLLFFIILFLAIISIPMKVFAQLPDDHTAREEVEGKEIWEKLQAKQITCGELTDDNFGSLGEYFMGQTAGDTTRHTAMNQMMTNMIGEKGEEQMHITLGKRSSGCDTNTNFPSGYNFMPMTWMLAPWRSSTGMGGGGNPVMGYGGWNNIMGGFGLFGWLSMIIFWLLLILGGIALVKWLATSGKTDSSKTPLEILKERYAKGEINKKEFEEMKKELS